MSVLLVAFGVIALLGLLRPRSGVPAVADGGVLKNASAPEARPAPAALQPVALPAATKDRLKQESGIMLLGIEPDGPAAKGGLILGDVLVSAAGKPLAEPEALAELLEKTAAGQMVKFGVLRAGELQDVEVRIGERPRKKG